jgi:AraC-like DNA-binding protein
MAEQGSRSGAVPVERAELVTQDMDLLAELIRKLYIEHTASFRCPDPALVDGRMLSAAVGGLLASVLRYGGFQYSAEVEPVNPPTAAMCVQGAGAVSSAREELRVAPGDVFLIPADRRAATGNFVGDFATLQVPWAAARALAEEIACLPAAGLRFQTMAPVSADRQRTFFKTVEFLCGRLVGSEASEISPLMAVEMTRLAAAAFLETFPNTTMTVPYEPDPGWVAPVTVRRAAAFIDANADQPVTVAEIAAAAGVTARALQYSFRRHYGTSPTGYLRRARLERAHLELHSARPGDGVTVAVVARKWGWASPARFAAAYRQRFGVPPRRTLRT